MGEFERKPREDRPDPTILPFGIVCIASAIVGRYLAPYASLQHPRDPQAILGVGFLAIALLGAALVILWEIVRIIRNETKRLLRAIRSWLN